MRSPVAGKPFRFYRDTSLLVDPCVPEQIASYGVDLRSVSIVQSVFDTVEAENSDSAATNNVQPPSEVTNAVVMLDPVRYARFLLNPGGNRTRNNPNVQDDGHNYNMQGASSSTLRGNRELQELAGREPVAPADGNGGV